MNNNGFTGSVEALGNLKQLKNLYMESNKFTGSVDALGKLKKLAHL